MGSIDRCFRNGLFALCALVLAGGSARADIVYASNAGNNTITAYDSASGASLGAIITAGAEASGFDGLRVLTDGSIVVAGQFTNNVVRYSRTGTLLDVFDPGNTGGLSSPQDVTIGPDGKLYVASGGNDRILRYDPATGDFLGTFADLSGLGHVGPTGLAFGPDGNLYVTTFDEDRVLVLDGHSGTILADKAGPAGIGFGPAQFGPDGNLYATSIDLSTFAGAVYRYDPLAGSLSLFIPPGSGGLGSMGGLAFGPDGNLLLTNLVFDASFNDTGSTMLKYGGQTGAPLGTLVTAGNGLNIPFFITVAPVPEPGSLALSSAALFLLLVTARRRPMRGKA